MSSNQSGQVTAEFIFSIVVVFGLFMLFLSISFTFSVVEAGQYIVYSTARAQAGGNKDQASQLAAAKNKYQQLGKDPAFAFMFQSGWFAFAKQPDVRQGNGTDFRTELGDGGSLAYQYLKVFTGASASFQSKILDLQIPFLKAKSGDDSGFKTNINAIIIREPSQAECYQYWDKRAQALKALPSGTSFYNPSSYTRMEDGGC